MSFSTFFSSDPGLTLVTGLLGTAWTAFRSHDWFTRRQNRRYTRALQALEAGVDDVYRTYVQAIKQASADGKLTREEAQHARKLARRRAIAFGRTTGIDVIRELGDEYIDLWIAKLVRKAKPRT